MVKKQRSNMGITEEYWAGLSEDKRLLWKGFCAVFTFFGAFFVVKTGVVYFDFLMALIASLFRWLVIESQRSRSRYSDKMRKMIARFTVSLGVWSVFLVGMLYFMNSVIFAIASTASTTNFPMLEARYGVGAKVGILVAVFLVGIYAAFRVFRDLNLMEAFYALPRELLIRLIVLRRFDFNGGLGFIRFELGLMVWTVFTVAAISIMASGVFDLLYAIRDAWIVVASMGA